MTQTVTVDRVKERRSNVAGYRPGMKGSRPLDAGEAFVNFVDKIRCVGNGDGTVLEYSISTDAEKVSIGNPIGDAIGGKQDTNYQAGQIASGKPVFPTPLPDATRWASRHAIAGTDFGLDVTQAEVAINQIMAALDARGGGILDLPVPLMTVKGCIDNHYGRVLVRGLGESITHDAGTPTYGTRIIAHTSIATVTLPGGAPRKVIARHRSPYGSGNAKHSGGGFVGVMLDANGVAQNNLIIDSVSRGKYEVYSHNAIGIGTRFAPGNAGIIMMCGTTGTDLAEACDTQLFHAYFLCRQLDGAAYEVDGVQLDGPGNANVSGGTLSVQGQYKEGAHLHVFNADNVNAEVRGFRAGGGGLLLWARGDKGDGRYCRGLRVTSLGSNGVPWLIEGTDSPGVTKAAEVMYDYRDFDNGTPDAVLGTGAKRYGNNGRGGLLGYGGTQWVTAVNEGNLNYAKTLVTNESHLIHNNSGRALTLANDGGIKASLGIATDGTGDIIFVIGGRTVRFSASAASSTI